ncbi:MAG: hypothetical protein RBU26_10535 [Sphaerochaeta sp.]|jgi:hypothetical protein|uniref:hypothetical protein n=1 Tax=Sphaerochaeta sp. TaxID=1972642 RepID=UPI002A35A24E|nr:hypothetical protein [Sphaerochaeta sp.]MDX9825362.1 hypothetical protein [Sphaerochaeta sp.]
MKKTIAILLVLVIGMVGVWAADALATTVEDAKITVNTTVAAEASFGLTDAETDVAEADFATKALFDAAVADTITTSIDMLDLVGNVEVGRLSGINNTATAITLYVSTTSLISGSNEVELTVSPVSATIPAAANSAFGTLKNEKIYVAEKTAGKAALAPAGSYSATVTINVTAI